MSSLDGSIVNIAIKAIAADLSMSFEEAQWIVIIYLLVSAITLISFGRISDLKGRKSFFLLGVSLFTLSSFFISFAFSGIFIISFRLIQGIGSSMIAANAPSMITDIFPREETGKALGVNVAFIYAGLVAGPILGGIIVQFITWRLIFFINVPIGISIFIIGWYKLKKVDHGIKGESYDFLGTIFFGLFLATLLLALTFGNQVGWSSFEVILLFIFSIFGFLSFIFVENKTKFPLFKLSLFRTNRIFSFANFAALLNYTAIAGTIFLLPIYLQLILGWPPLMTALFLLPTTLTMAIISSFSGRLSDKLGTRILTTSGMIVMAIGFIMLTLVIGFLPIQYIILTQLIVGLGIGLFSSPNNSAVMNAVEGRDHGIAAGILSTMRVVGQSTSIALLSAILTFFIPIMQLNIILSNPTYITDSLIKAEFTVGLMTVLIFSVIFCIFGALLSFMRGKRVPFNEKT